MKTLITAPVSEPITLAEAKNFLRVEENDDDALINLLIGAARRRAEFLTGRVLLTQTWLLNGNTIAAALGCPIVLDVTPAQAVVSFQYYDAANALQTLTDFAYVPSETHAYLKPPAAGWPTLYDRADALQITVRAGYGDTAAAVPEEIRQWMLLRIGTAYEQRQALVIGATSQELPASYVDGLLDPYRIWEL